MRIFTPTCKDDSTELTNSEKNAELEEAGDLLNQYERHEEIASLLQAIHYQLERLNKHMDLINDPID